MAPVRRLAGARLRAGRERFARPGSRARMAARAGEGTSAPGPTSAACPSGGHDRKKSKPSARGATRTKSGDHGKRWIRGYARKVRTRMRFGNDRALIKIVVAAAGRRGLDRVGSLALRPGESCPGTYPLKRLPGPHSFCMLDAAMKHISSSRKIRSTKNCGASLTRLALAASRARSCSMACT
jgi:hypothetical protein